MNEKDSLIIMSHGSSTSEEESLKALRSSTGLDNLWIARVISANEASEIAAILKKNTTLRSLGFRGEWGKENLLILEALKENDTLQNLTIRCRIGQPEIMLIAAALKGGAKLEELVLYGPVKSEELVLDDAVKFDGIKVIAEALKENKTLRSVNLGHNGIGSDGAKAIAETLKENKTLRSVNLGFNDIGPDGAVAIAEALKVNKTLRDMDLNLNPIKCAGAIAIAEALKVNKALQNVDLGFNEIKSDGAEAIAEALKVNKTLENVDLGSNYIKSDGAKAIAEALKGNKTLRSVKLGSNEIGSDGAKAIAETLQENKTLRSVNLGSNDIGPDGAVAIAEALKVNKTLRDMDLNRNNIKSGGAKAIADALKVNDTLRNLNPSYNDIGSDGAKAFAEALEVNRTLESLDLSEHEHQSHYKPDVVEAFIRALQKNSSLRVLDYRYISYALDKTLDAILARNYTIQEISGIIQSRNKSISDCISSIHTPMFKGSLETPELLDQAITELQTLVPGIGTDKAPFDDDNQIAENFRLFKGLRYAMESSDPLYLMNTLRLFNAAFHWPPLQKAADVAMAEALSLSDCFDTATRDAKMARYQLALYGYRNHSNLQNYLPQLKNVLSQLKDPSQKSDPNNARLSMTALVGAEELISYDAILAIAQEALLSVQDDNERNCLNQLCQQATYDPMTCDFFWRSPSVRDLFREHYPEVTTFRVLENYLLNPTTSEVESKAAKEQIAVPYQSFSITDPMIKLDVAQLNQQKPFPFAAFLQDKKRVMMMALTDVMLADQLIPAVMSVLQVASRTPFVQLLEKTKLDLRQFFHSKSSARDFAAFYQRLLTHFKDNPAICLLIVGRLMRSDAESLLPLQDEIIAAVAPEEDVSTGRRLLQESLSTSLSTLSRQAIQDVISLNKALDALDETQAISILDNVSKAQGMSPK